MLSFWHSVLDPEPPRPPLGGSRSADVCIVGAGYTGLWTAYELRRADPSLDVVVLEAETAGFGASGRNGGWVLGELSGRHSRGGSAGAIAQTRAIEATVDEIGRVVAAEGIDCDFVKGGSLHVAQTPLELERVAEEDGELLDAEATRARVAVAGALGASFTPHCARVQPAKLARGLARAAERAGALICEGTRATRIAPGRVDTPYGSVRSPFVVRATEGYTAGLPGLRRLLLPLTSAMIVTAPLGPDVWAEIGWERCETLLDGQRRYAYLQRTADGRIAIGGRGVPYRWGSSTDREGPLDPRTVAELRTRLAELFPVLRDVAVDGAWHGVLGVPRDWSPAVGLDRATGIAWAGGYVGEGVAAANLAGRTLRDLLLGRSTELTALPWVGPFARPWEPEPLRFAAVHAVHGLMRFADDRERSGGRPSAAGRAAEAISGR